MEDITSQQNKPSELKSFIRLIAIALFIRFFIIELFFVPTGSMKLTILEGDYLFSTKYSYGFSKHSLPFSPPIFSGRILSSPPNRGDIVIFRPPHNMDIRYIKRLVGLPGDKIQLIDDLIYINNVPIKREALGIAYDEKGRTYNKFKETLPNNVSYYAYKLKDDDNFQIHNRFGNTELFYVPKDKYFFLGDNRDESNDSRIDLGFVPFENFIAKAQFIFFSTKELLWQEDSNVFQALSRSWTWISSIRFKRIFNSLYKLD